MSIKQSNHYPKELLTVSPECLHSLVPEPTLFNVLGKHQAPIFISVLLHGNEPTGFLALQKLLLKYQQQTLPRSLTFFLGNTEAASQGLRQLDKQADYNRIWPGTELTEHKMALMAREIVDIMKKKGIFASIDIHNNSGLNPHYACINKLNQPFLQLASLFTQLVVYFIRPKGVQSAAFAEICPAVTLECGKPGQAEGVEHVFEYLDRCLNLTELSKPTPATQAIDIYHTVAQVKINQDINFSFDNITADLLLNKEIEQMNFTQISAGTQLGTVLNHSKFPLTAKDETGAIVTEAFFSIVNNSLQFNKNTLPSMLTLDEKIIRQDCFCYLMEKIRY